MRLTLLVLLFLFLSLIQLCSELPPNPENLQVVSTDKGRISLAWQPAKEALDAPVDGYLIEMAPGNSKDFQEVGRIEGNDMCVFDANGLKEGQKYNFRVKALNQRGTSPGFASLDKPVAASPMGEICVFFSSLSFGD